MLEWAEKYRPKSLSEVVGHDRPVRELRAWAKSWDHNPKKKAAVLSGDAGVGKTSAALALAADLGWTVVEMNASDRRTAAAVEEVATRGALLQTFSADGEYHTAASGRRKLIILDEADNLFGNQDRGGVAQISETIKVTKQPIILIVNDYYELTRRSSAIKSRAKEIRFPRLRADSVIAVLRRVCEAEGVQASEAVFRTIAEKAKGDLRGALNDMQSVAEGRKRVTEKDLEVIGWRDAEESVFDALGEIFRSGNAQRAREAAWAVDEDPERLILWIDENLPNQYRDRADLARGMWALARADEYLGRTRTSRVYRLWGYATDLMTAGVAVAREGPAGSGAFRFPLWLAKMSRSRGRRSVNMALAQKIGRRLHMGSRQFITEVLPTLRELYRADPELRITLAAACDLAPKEIAALLGETDDAEAVKRVVSEAAKLVTRPGTHPQFLAGFGSDA